MSSRGKRTDAASEKNKIAQIGRTASSARADLGSRGEAIAAGYLQQLGYEIRERNFRCPLGELDLVAQDGEYIVFVEVKTRTAGHQMHPAESVTVRKRDRVRQLGEYYRAHHLGLSDKAETVLQPRFDVIAVVVGDASTLAAGIGGVGIPAPGEQVEHLVNAF